MKHKNGFWDRLAERADLPGEAMPRQCILELVGDKRILIERHAGIREYSLERIRIKVDYGELCICGNGLHMARMCSSQLVITGSIDSVTVIRRR